MGRHRSQTKKNSVRAYVFRFDCVGMSQTCQGTASFVVALHLAKHIVPEPERLFIKIKLHASRMGQSIFSNYLDATLVNCSSP